MRFRFPDDDDEVEARARAAMLARMDAWWSAFASKAESIDRHFLQGNQFDVPAFMAEHLGAVDERIMWEFGPALRGARHRLVITSEGNRGLRPMVDVLVARAPTVPGWEIYGHRVPESPERAELVVRGRSSRSLQGWRACVAANEEGGIDLTFWSPRDAGFLGLAFWRRRIPRSEQDQARSAAFVAAESLIGEEVLLRWVDSVELAAAPLRGAPDVALGDVRASVEAAIERRQAALPDRPLCEPESAPALPEERGRQHVGYVMDLHPKEATEYVGKQDLFVATTVLLPVWKRAHSGRPFYSGRFSRHGETFCYLKIDGSEGLGPGGFANRSEIEGALDEALLREHLGCAIGGGTGLRYSYVDLALIDVERAIPVLRAVLRAGRIPKRTWLQFFDSEFASEWVRIWPDAPIPPGQLP